MKAVVKALLLKYIHTFEVHHPSHQATDISDNSLKMKITFKVREQCASDGNTVSRREADLAS